MALWAGDPGSELSLPPSLGLQLGKGLGHGPRQSPRREADALLCSRAEPVLSRIQESRKRVILPSIDNIKQDSFEVQRYENSAHGYSWELWCMYISPPKDWWDAGDPSLPIRSVTASSDGAAVPRSQGRGAPEQGWEGRPRAGVLGCQRPWGRVGVGGSEFPAQGGCCPSSAQVGSAARLSHTEGLIVTVTVTLFILPWASIPRTVALGPLLSVVSVTIRQSIWK